MFTHLHWHSTFSFLEWIGKVPQLLGKAKDLWMQSIAITDYNWLFSAVSFYKEAKDKWIKPIIWVELWFVIDIETNYDEKNIWNICIIAKNWKWYESLVKLVSFANTEWLKGKQKIDIKTLKKYSDWIIVFAGWVKSWIGKLIENNEKDEKIIEILNMQKDVVWGENIFLEIVAQNYEKVKTLNKINDKLLEISKITNIECIVNNDFHYINKEDKPAWEIALAIKDGHKIYDDNRRKPEWDFHIFSEEEIRQTLQANSFENELIDKLISTNNKIAENIETKIELWQSLFPNYESPEDIIQIYEKYKDELIIPA